MRVQFKNTKRMSYKVLDEGIEYDEILKKYCDCYKLEWLGWVGKETLEPADPELVDCTEIMVYLANNRDAV